VWRQAGDCLLIPSLPQGLPSAGRVEPHDTQDGAGEQDGEGPIGADEDGGEGGGHDVEGCRGGVGQRGEEADEGADEGRGRGRDSLPPPDTFCHPVLVAPPSAPPMEGAQKAGGGRLGATHGAGTATADGERTRRGTCLSDAGRVS